MPLRVRIAGNNGLVASARNLSECSVDGVLAESNMQRKQIHLTLVSVLKRFERSATDRLLDKLRVERATLPGTERSRSDQISTMRR